MDCWQLLGLEPNADVKAIKLAYSKLLKKTRPDEDPEGFQKLREAYTNALAASHSAPNRQGDFNTELNQPDKSSVELPSIDSPEAVSRSTEASAIDLPANQPDVATDGLALEWMEFIGTVEGLLDDPEKLNSKKEWKNILSSPILVDLQYRDTASERIFCLVADVCLDEKRNPEEKIDTDILHYLSEEFQWENHKYHLLFRFGDKRTDAVFIHLDEKSIDRTFRLVGIAGSLLGFLVMVCGYYRVSFFVVILTAAVPATVRRLYVKRWQTKRQGFSDGGDTEFINGNKTLHALFVYLSMCIAEALFYGIGWMIRFAVDYIAR